MDSQLILDIAQESCNLNYIHTENSNSLERVCRTCLTERGELRPLFSERLNEMLVSFTAVQVSLNDGLPPNICSQCVLHISRAYSFKQQAENSDSTLRQYIFQNSQDSLATNILELNYGASNIPGPNQHNVVSDKTQYFSENLNLQTPTEQIKLEPEHKIVVARKKVEEILEKKKEQNYIENYHSDNDDNGADDDFSVKEEESNNCDICSSSFTNVKDLEKHMKTHSKTKDHVCSECGKSFQYKVGLKTHMRSHGIGERRHECKHCGKRFYELNDCVVHERRHTGDRPIVCETCGKTFADPRSLAKHVKIHSGEKNYQCDVCNKKFIHSYTLTAHKRVHTGEKPFVCNICGHACATSTQLTLHMRTHTQERPYVCSLCSKGFASKSGLATHQMTHTGERKYICSICGKGSRTSTDLNSHLRTHTGEKPYECKIPLCTKRYKTHSQLSAHMRTHTEDISDQECDTNIDSTRLVITSNALNILSDSDFKNNFRLSKSAAQVMTFYKNTLPISMLIKEIGPSVIPPNPRRPAVPVPTAILLFLWTITHDESFHEISKRFQLGQGHSHRIFVAMCTNLANKKDKFIKWPTGKLQEQTIEEFRQLDEKEFPNVIGAVDCIHVSIPSPANDGSFFNEHGFSSIILQGICNANMEIMDICVDSPGSSTTAWLDSPIYQKLTKDKKILPVNTFIIADNDYKKSDILLSLTNKDDALLNKEENIFYNILIKKLSCVKRSFRLLQRNFKRLQNVKIKKIKYAKDLIIAACILHNILLKQDNSMEENIEIDNENTELSVKLNSIIKETVNYFNPDEEQIIYVVNEEDLVYLIDDD